MNELVAVVEETGEVVPVRESLSMGRLLAHADETDRLTVLRLEIEERIRFLCIEDMPLEKFRCEERDLVRRLATDKEALAQAFAPEVRKSLGGAITIDLGRIRFTWPKPTERWVQRIKPALIFKRRPDLAEELGIELVMDEPRAPIVTVRPPRELTS